MDNMYRGAGRMYYDICKYDNWLIHKGTKAGK